MPIYKIHLNFQISDRLLEYIRLTYSANIKGIATSGNHTQIRVNAPNEAALQPAIDDLRSKLIEVGADI